MKGIYYCFPYQLIDLTIFQFNRISISYNLLVQQDRQNQHYFSVENKMLNFQDNAKYVGLSSAMFVCGLYLGSFGVLIPYYSQQSGEDQTYYSFTFVVRSLAFMSGSLLIKLLVHKISAQKIIVSMLSLLTVSLFLCSLSTNQLNLTAMLYVSGTAYIILIVLFYSLVPQIYKNNKPELRTLIGGVIFGLGASLAAPIAMYLELNTYKALSILCGFCLLFFFKYQIPSLEENSSAQQSKKQISSKTQLFICLMMLIFPNQESIASWIPTYSIKAEIATFQTAGLFSLLFWLPDASLRIVWVLMPYKTTNKVRFIVTTLLFTSTLVIIFQFFQLYSLVCFTSSLVFGSMVSCMYGFIMTIALDNGFKTTPSNNANFTLAYCLGEILFSGPIGYSMRIFGFKSLLVIVLMGSILNYLCFNQAVASMAADQSSKDLQKPLKIQLEELKTKHTI